MIRKERIYHSDIVEGEYRCLVDRLWPRGISKDVACLDAWEKNLGPSSELRVWFNHEVDKFEEFKRKYLLELQAPEKQSILKSLKDISKSRDIVLLFGAREETYNQASVLLEVLENMND